MKDTRKFSNIPSGPVENPPAPPKNLDATGREVWNIGATYLVDRQLLHSGDLPGLEAWAASMAMSKRLEHDLIDQPLMVESPQGLKPNPLLAMLQKQHAVARGWATSLMLLPNTRQGLAKDKRDGKTDAAAGGAWEGLIDIKKVRK